MDVLNSVLLDFSFKAFNDRDKVVDEELKISFLQVSLENRHEEGLTVLGVGETVHVMANRVKRESLEESITAHSH